MTREKHAHGRNAYTRLMPRVLEGGHLSVKCTSNVVFNSLQPPRQNPAISGQSAGVTVIALIAMIGLQLTPPPLLVFASPTRRPVPRLVPGTLGILAIVASANRLQKSMRRMGVICRSFAVTELTPHNAREAHIRSQTRPTIHCRSCNIRRHFGGPLSILSAAEGSMPGGCQGSPIVANGPLPIAQTDILWRLHGFRPNYRGDQNNQQRWNERAVSLEYGHGDHAAHSADNASACCKTFRTAASCKSGG